MDISKELAEAKQHRQELVDQVNQIAENINQLEQERKRLLHEAVLVAGEVRALERLQAQTKAVESKKS